jgi:hypothetical protein
MSQPSRQDSKHLMSGYAGVFFNSDCLQPTTSRWRCDIRTSETIGAGLLPNTRGLLLLGDKALHEWGEDYSNYTIQELRGSPIRNRFNLPCICSFSPQDAIDPVDHESRLNYHITEAAHDDDDDSDEYDTKKRHGRTRRSNYRFWLVRDVKKLLWGIENGTQPEKYEIRIYPSIEEIFEVIKDRRNQYVEFDIETDSDKNLLCFSLGFEGSNIFYSIPILRYDYSLAYGLSTYEIIRKLIILLNRNTIVIHNCMFDLFVLAHKYRIGFPRSIYDTMFAQHRCFPEAEKSLGHSLSCWPEIWEPFHKDEGIFEPKNLEQEKQLWTYNAKDAAAMRFIRTAQMKYAKSVDGLEWSIQQSNSLMYPFLLNTLHGMNVDVERRETMMKENDRLLNHYQRALDYLTKPYSLNASSNPSCCNYFHGLLDYPVVGRSKKTGEPSLNETNLLKLKLKNPDNAAIDFCIKYRQVKKEFGSLKFIPWKE